MFHFFFRQVNPGSGTVGFGSGLHGWGFTLKQFAEIYSSKWKKDFAEQTPAQQSEIVKTMMEKLWGDR